MRATQAVEVVPGFDLKTETRDPKTGLVVSRNPYRLRVIGDGSGNRQKLMERPVGSGNIYNMEGKPVGRWEETVVEGKPVGKFVEGAAHKVFVAPLTDDQKLAKSVVDANNKIAALEKELANIRAESQPKKSDSTAKSKE